MAKDKTPKVAPSVEKSLGRKVPKASPAASGFDTFHPAFCLSSVDRSGDFSWENIDPVDLKRVVCKLRDLSGMRWTEILGHHNHGVPVTDLAKEARDRLLALKLDDYDRVHTFRVTGAERVWYIKHEHHAFLLWWDPEHRICPSQK